MAKERSTVEDFIIDFSKQEDGAGGSIRVPEATYAVQVLGAKPVTSSEKGTPGLEIAFMITDGKYRGKKFTERLWATPKAYGRFRSLLEACGKKVPDRVNLTRIAAAIKGCELYVELQDDKPQEGFRTRSRVAFEGFIHPDNAEGAGEPDDSDVEDEDEDETPAPKAKRKSTKPATPVTDDDEDDELDELDLDEL